MTLKKRQGRKPRTTKDFALLPDSVENFWKRLHRFSASTKRCSKCGRVKVADEFTVRLASDKRKTHAVFYKGQWFVERRAECKDCWELAKCRETQELKKLRSEP